MRTLLLTTMLCGTALAAEYPKPERHVQANVIISVRDPKLRIKLPSAVQYVGADRWPLLGIADCELHVFVEASPQRKVQRLYWLQFEAYLPSRPELHHTYSFARTETLSGLLRACASAVAWQTLSNAGGDDERPFRASVGPGEAERAHDHLRRRSESHGIYGQRIAAGREAQGRVAFAGNGIDPKGRESRYTPSVLASYMRADSVSGVVVD